MSPELAKSGEQKKINFLKSVLDLLWIYSITFLLTKHLLFFFFLIDRTWGEYKTVNINDTIIHNLAQIQQVKLTLPILPDFNQGSTCSLVLRLLLLADKPPPTNGGAFI